LFDPLSTAATNPIQDYSDAAIGNKHLKVQELSIKVPPKYDQEKEELTY
jgi:hypothetical protein